MKLHEWQRSTLIAHLSVHGWEPVREVPSAQSGYGLYNRDSSWGLRVLGEPRPTSPVRAIDSTRIRPAAWDDIGDLTLKLIAKAIDDTNRTWTPT